MFHFMLILFVYLQMFLYEPFVIPLGNTWSVAFQLLIFTEIITIGNKIIKDTLKGKT